MKHSSFHLGYRPALDGLRAVAVLGVVGLHFRVPGFRYGFLGVDIFFVLSGFLITCLLVEEWERSRAINLADFYLRRALRLLPALWLMLLLLAPVLSLGEILPPLLYVSNWASVLAITPNNMLLHLWSLGVEGQFYLLWPPVLALLLRKRLPSGIVLAVPVLLAAGFSLFSAGLASAGESGMRTAYGTDTRGVGMWVGSALALAAEWGLLPRRPGRRWLLPSMTGIALLGLVALGYGHYDDSAEFARGLFLLVAVISALVIAQLSVYDSPGPVRLLAWKPLVVVGRVSYGIYLWHYVFAWLFRESPWYLALAIGLPLTGFVVALSYRFVERPALRLKRGAGQRLAARRASNSGTTP